MYRWYLVWRVVVVVLIFGMKNYEGWWWWCWLCRYFMHLGHVTLSDTISNLQFKYSLLLFSSAERWAVVMVVVCGYSTPLGAGWRVGLPNLVRPPPHYPPTPPPNNFGWNRRLRLGHSGNPHVRCGGGRGGLIFKERKIVNSTVCLFFSKQICQNKTYWIFGFTNRCNF